MPGAYAHITLVNELRDPAYLEAIPGFPLKAISALLDYLKFCELGAVSPDYPYLAVGDSNATNWADAMHYIQTGEMIHAGVSRLKAMQGETQRKGLAWLLGYSSHVVADVTIHPIVELQVGSYADHKMGHRTCEMHQDAYIFQRLNLGDVGLSEHLDSGIGACSSSTDDNNLDDEIEDLWRSMFRDVYPREFVDNPPDINKWHQWFNMVVDDIAEEGNKLMPFARHVAAGLGLTYPSADQIEREYIENLQVPGGQEGYDEIFNYGIENVGTIWQLVASGVLEGGNAYLTRIGNWNLDTGRNENGQLVFWR